MPQGHAPSADGLCIDWRDIITKTTRLDGPFNSSIRETCAVLSGTRSSPECPGTSRLRAMLWSKFGSPILWEQRRKSDRDNDLAFYGSYASLLRVERNTSVGNVPMCSASQTAFSTFSDQLLKSANLRKIHFMWQRPRLKNHLEAPLKPSLGINPGRNAPVIKSNDRSIPLGDQLFQNKSLVFTSCDLVLI